MKDANLIPLERDLLARGIQTILEAWGAQGTPGGRAFSPAGLACDIADHVIDMNESATYSLTDGATLGAMLTVKGSLMKAATDYIDWEKLHHHEPDAVGVEGRILMELARRLPS